MNASTTDTITLGGGCFWCLEAVYERVDGVTAVESGYANGHVANPTYEQVCRGDTGHAEVVRVTFEPSRITLREVLEIFFTIHDPTTLNRQGADTGTQYRSAIYYHSARQKQEAEEMIAALTRDKVFDSPIVTEIAPLDRFYPAEEYHRDYYRRNPNQGYCRAVIAPKVSKLRKQWEAKLKVTSDM